MSDIHTIAAAITHLRRAFAECGLDAPVSIEVDSKSFTRLKMLAGRDVSIIRNVAPVSKPTGNYYMDLAGQRIDECLF